LLVHCLYLLVVYCPRFDVGNVVCFFQTQTGDIAALITGVGTIDVLENPAEKPNDCVVCQVSPC
jgi:hypothetical protein